MFDCTSDVSVEMNLNRVMLNTAGEAGEAGDVFSRPSYDSPAAGGNTPRVCPVNDR